MRIAFAIGLHRDDIKHSQSPLGRELRKQLWWTLYSFEQMQVSSFDRPSAIWQTVSSVSSPNERIIGGNYPQDFMKWSQRLVVLLGSACRALNPGTVLTAVEDAYNRPLSPAAGILRDLNKWKEALPPHIRLEATDSLAPSSQRQLLLLHAQFHYIVILISRSALLRRATILSKSSRDTLPQILITVSETCIDSGQALSRILRKLEAIGKYNALTWWDVFITVNATVVLALENICHVKQYGSGSPSESLRELAALAARQLENPRIPPSIQKWASLVIEISSVAKQFTDSPHPHGGNESRDSNSEPNHIFSAELDNPFRLGSSSWGSPIDPELLTDSLASTSWNAAISLEDSNVAREHASQFWAQFSLTDEMNDQINSWN